MKKEIRKCAVCGKKFTPKVANALTCSKKCYKVRKAVADKARKAKKPEDLPVSRSVKEVKKVAKVEKKPAVKKTVKETIVLPKAKSVVIKKGDNICFDGFGAYDLILLASRLIAHTLENIQKSAEKAACKCKKEVKPTKKVAKK